MNEGYVCVCGSRFIKGGGTIDYPKIKYLLNRITNFCIRVMFDIPRTGTAKLKLKEMGSRYFFICTYVWLEKNFSWGDYIQKP